MKDFYTLLFLVLSVTVESSFAQTRVIAHRGYWKTDGSAQNSIAALKKAQELSIYGSEFDVQLTADNYVVVNHDDSIAGYRIDETKLKKLQSVRLANGEKIPTLDDYLKQGQRNPSTMMILEVKPHRTEQQENRCAKIEKVSSYGMQAQTEFISFSLNICEQLAKLNPNALVSYLGGDIAPTVLMLKGIRGIDYHYSVLLCHPQWIEEAHRLGMKVNVWTVDDLRVASQLIDMKVDFITTNIPVEMKALSVSRRWDSSASWSDDRPLAFPTAEGYGKYTVGGRGGKVYEVTNLNDSGEGSLRAAVEAKGPRVVVFRVSGIISLEKELKIRNPYITIAGQTAPGDGICLRGYPLNIDADEIIIRYLRVRLGDETGTESDAISSRFHKNIILDHISASWSVDETMSFYHCENITVQWCMITESLFASNHFKGPHGFGGIWGSNYSTYHHNLIAHHSSRNPRFCGGAGYTDYRNNVIYNWGYNSCYGGGGNERKDPRFQFSQINMVANYYKPGPATEPGLVSHRIANPSWSDGMHGLWYIADNYMEDDEEVTSDNWLGVHPNSELEGVVEAIKCDSPWPAMPIRQQTAQEAYQAVLENAGAVLPQRDVIDQRIVNDVRSGIPAFEGPTYKQRKQVADSNVKTGIIDTPSDVGGWPELKSAIAPLDSDHDGMPDEWEISHGLDPHDSADGARFASCGYTYLEVYLNETGGIVFIPES